MNWRWAQILSGAFVALVVAIGGFVAGQIRTQTQLETRLNSGLEAIADLRRGNGIVMAPETRAAIERLDKRFEDLQGSLNRQLNSLEQRLLRLEGLARRSDESMQEGKIGEKSANGATKKGS